MRAVEKRDKPQLSESIGGRTAVAGFDNLEDSHEITLEEKQQIGMRIINLVELICNTDFVTAQNALDELYNLIKEYKPDTPLELMIKILLVALNHSLPIEIRNKSFFNVGYMMYMNPPAVIHFPQEIVVQLLHEIGPGMTKSAKSCVMAYISSSPKINEILNAINFVNICIERYLSGQNVSSRDIKELHELFQLYIANSQKDDNDLGINFLPLLQNLGQSNDTEIFGEFIGLLNEILNQCSTPQVFDLIFQMDVDNRCIALFDNLRNAARMEVVDLFETISERSFYLKQLWDRGLVLKISKFISMSNEYYDQKSLIIWSEIILLGIEYVKAAIENHVFDKCLEIIDSGSFEMKKTAFTVFNHLCKYISDESVQTFLITHHIAAQFASYLDTDKTMWYSCLIGLRIITEFVFSHSDTEFMENPLFEGIDFEYLYDNITEILNSIGNPSTDDEETIYKHANYFASILEADFEPNFEEPEEDE